MSTYTLVIAQYYNKQLDNGIQITNKKKDLKVKRLRLI